MASKTVSAKLTRAQLTLLAAFAIQVIRERIARSENVKDAAAAPYKNDRKIYVPNTGGGRTKSGLGGREVLTKADRAKLRKAKISLTTTRSGKSTVFPNYSAYKQSLGKSGNRDLELSGRMLGAIAPAEITEEEAVIGFTREEEEAKMRGNERWEKMWGFSPTDSDAILKQAEQLILQNWKETYEVGF